MRQFIIRNKASVQDWVAASFASMLLQSVRMIMLHKGVWISNWI